MLGKRMIIQSASVEGTTSQIGARSRGATWTRRIATSPSSLKNQTISRRLVTKACLCTIPMRRAEARKPGTSKLLSMGHPGAGVSESTTHRAQRWLKSKTSRWSTLRRSAERVKRGTEAGIRTVMAATISRTGVRKNGALLTRAHAQQTLPRKRRATSRKQTFRDGQCIIRMILAVAKIHGPRKITKRLA